MIDRYPLAPMTTGLAVATWFLWLLPAMFVALAMGVPAPVGWLLHGTAAFMVLMYAGVWLAGRPTAFEIEGGQLRIVWPVRERVIPLSTITGARTISSDEFRQEYGYGMRIGAGGLWGGFGLLRTERTTFSMWISRTDSFVLVTLDGERPLMLTPTDPERYIAALGVLSSARS